MISLLRCIEVVTLGILDSRGLIQWELESHTSCLSSHTPLAGSHTSSCSSVKALRQCPLSR